MRPPPRFGYQPAFPAVAFPPCWRNGEAVAGHVGRFSSGAIEMTADQLLDLRIEFLKARDHPMTIEAIDRELKRRATSGAESCTSNYVFPLTE